MAWYNWSQTPAANATADSTINWQEGQAPSSINDSARAMMAATAKYRDDIAGAILTAGTNTAYTVTSYSVFDTLAHLNGQMIAFTPHTTNGAVVTLNVDSLGPKPLRSAPNVELQAGTIIQGTPYVATYNNSDGAFYLHGFYGNPYNVPLGAGMEYWGTTAPNSSFAFPYGQAISRTTYSTLFNNIIGTTYGSGDGSTTFNLPDVRGRVVASPDNMGSGDAGRLADGQSSMASQRYTIGGTGGAVTHQLSTAEMPQHNHSISLSDPGHLHNYQSGAAQYAAQAGGGGGAAVTNVGNYTSTSYTGISASIGYQGGNYTHENCQPTILAYRIMRII